MSDIDLFSYILLAVGLLLAFLLFFAKKWSALIAKYWARIFGFAMGSLLFVSLIVARVLFFPKTNFLSHTISNFFLSVVFGGAVWIVFGVSDRITKRRK